MKLTSQVLRKIIKEELTQASQKRRGAAGGESPAQGVGANLGIELGKLINGLLEDPSFTASLVSGLAAEDYVQKFAMDSATGNTDEVVDAALKHLTKELHQGVKNVVIDLFNEVGL